MYNFKAGDLVLEELTNTQVVGLVIDTWDDYQEEKMIRIIWTRKDDGTQYTWEYGKAYLIKKIRTSRMKYIPVKETT
jgi:hypothetical protein